MCYCVSFEARVLSVCDCQRSEDEDLLEGSEEQAETSHKRRRFDEAALERKRELRLWNEQRKVIIGSRPSDHYFRSVCLFVCLFVCLSVFCLFLFSDVFDPIWIKLGHTLHVRV